MRGAYPYFHEEISVKVLKYMFEKSGIAFIPDFCKKEKEKCEDSGSSGLKPALADEIHSGLKVLL